MRSWAIVVTAGAPAGSHFWLIVVDYASVAFEIEKLTVYLKNDAYQSMTADIGVCGNKADSCWFTIKIW